jgi:hypothetical protein
MSCLSVAFNSCLPLIIATIGLYQLTNDLAFCLKRVGKLWAIEIVCVDVQEDIH